VQGSSAAVADGKGEVVVLDVRTGQATWRASVAEALSAGVGFDGNRAAVVTRLHDLVALESGKVIWRTKLNASSHTAPLVAGGRVFVLGADRAVSAFDGASGRRLWTQQRPGEPLVLRQAGVLLAVGDTLVAGISGKLVGLNPSNGSIRWEAPVATPRGINDVERLVDLVGPAFRAGDEVCVRAFQAAVACTNAARGTLTWTKPSAGSVGLSGDNTQLYGTDEDGTVGAWRRSDGERVWSTQNLRFRGLSAPLALGAGLVVGDAQGYLHVLSKDSGDTLSRISLDGSALAGAPVLAANTLVVVTAKGLVAGLRPGN
jgi:outer membrane assembly lipoprotein YfgL